MPGTLTSTTFTVLLCAGATAFAPLRLPLKPRLGLSVAQAPAGRAEDRGAVAAAAAASPSAAAATAAEEAAGLYSVATSRATLGEAAAFFVDNFWLPQASPDFALSEAQRAGLAAAQLEDFEERYGELMGARRLSSALLLKRDDAGLIAGAVSVELTLVNVDTESMISRKDGEAMFKQRIGSLGPKQRRELKDLPVGALTEELFPEFEVLPVLSNLCVAASARRQGLGNELCAAAANVARGWGFFELWLQVEADNAPARTLYEKKLGFEEEWADKGARALRIDEEDEGGAFKDVVVPTVTASKFLARG